ncbi:MAG: hypothetical protein KJ927_16705, partial [Candidatus Eisenbacteria bacterium]|nr:hypothetical protein [Candidatus Eisenbacteria bacterium]
AYLPVIENVLGNRFLAKHPAHRFFILSERLPQVAGHMLSYRYALLLIVLPGFFRAFRDASRRLQGSSKAAALLGLFFLPFGFSFLRNDAAFERTFVNLTPVFALILAAGCGWMIQGRKRTVWIRWSIPLICAIALATLGFAYAHLQQRLQDNLQKGFHEQSILANQYQAAGYHPAETAETLAEMVRMEPGPVILVGALDRVAWSFYLDKVDIPSLALVRIEALPPQDRNGASTHAGIFQVSQGMGRETVFVQQDLLISKEPEDLILTPLIQFVGSREFTGPIYLVTDSPVLVSSLLETHFPGFEGKRLGRSMDAGSLFVLRPGRS